MRRKTQASKFIAASPEAVFAVVSDHVGTPGWVPKVREVALLTPGEPTNGVPAVRRITFRPVGWPTVDERITAYDTDKHTFSYTIIAGMFGVRDHLGTFSVTPTEGGCTVTWAVQFDFNPWLWTLAAGVFLKTFTKAMEEGLSTLAEQHAS